MENKIFAYMRISTNKKTQKVDRQQQTIIEYSVSNGFRIDEFVSDVITGGIKADNRPNYHDMKKQFTPVTNSKQPIDTQSKAEADNIFIPQKSVYPKDKLDKEKSIVDRLKYFDLQAIFLQEQLIIRNLVV